MSTTPEMAEEYAGGQARVSRFVSVRKWARTA